MDEDKIKAHLSYWQRILRLQDWDIDVRIERLHTMGDGLTGQCIREDNSRTARVRLLDPQDYNADALPPGDFEETLVHELLHVVFHGASNETENRVAFEQAIDSTARALVGFDRSIERSC